MNCREILSRVECARKIISFKHCWHLLKFAIAGAQKALRLDREAASDTDFAAFVMDWDLGIPPPYDLVR